ncbi:MAG: ArgE/DapE family deacylase [Alcaligenaceae bacterium]|nr:ArgE/DapE family deacylase [Alcaligenaceae bacterium]
MDSNTINDRLAGWVDQNFDAEVAFLQQLVRMPTDTPPGDNAPYALAVAGMLEEWGWQVGKHPVPSERVRAYGMESITNLVIRREYGAGPTIALNAHGDVVPPGEGWTFPPYGGQVHDGRLYGRAAAVSKSDYASYLFAVRALEASGARLKGAIELHFTCDEEFGGLLGPGWLLDEGLVKPDLAICAAFSHAVVMAHNGCLQFEVTVNGKATHGAVPHTGHDALRAANKILDAIYTQADKLATVRSSVAGIDHPTMIVGRIAGGTNTNVVPGQVVLKMDRRMIPEEDPAQVEQDVRSMIENAVQDLDGIRVEIRRLLLANALRPLPGHEKLVSAIQQAARTVLGEDIPAVGTPLYADARLYAERGIPVVMYGAGPRTLLESNAKRADENIALEDLRAATKVIGMALATLLAADGR